MTLSSWGHLEVSMQMWMDRIVGDRIMGEARERDLLAKARNSGFREL